LFKNSLIIICYNEIENLKLLKNKIKIISKKIDGEILLVDNGSTDQTYNYLIKLSKLSNKIRILKIKKNKGYGYGIYQALKKTKGSIVGWSHGDGQYDFLHSLSLFKILSKKKNPRIFFLKGIRKNRNFIDNFFTLCMALLASLIFQRKLYDINGLPVAFHRSLIFKFKYPPNNYEFDFYVYLCAKINNLKIIRKKISIKKRIKGNSTWNKGLHSIIKLSFNYIVYFIKTALKLHYYYK
jgi:glycosyltransferase involved in cell wall biosynthesis